MSVHRPTRYECEVADRPQISMVVVLSTEIRLEHPGAYVANLTWSERQVVRRRQTDHVYIPVYAQACTQVRQREHADTRVRTHAYAHVYMQVRVRRRELGPDAVELEELPHLSGPDCHLLLPFSVS